MQEILFLVLPIMVRKRQNRDKYHFMTPEEKQTDEQQET